MHFFELLRREVNNNQNDPLLFQIDNMILLYDNVTRSTRNQDGVETRVPGFGNSSSVEWIDPSQASAGAYFKDIANALVPAGFTRDLSLRGAPYDFRKGPSKFVAYWEQTYSQVLGDFSFNRGVLMDFSTPLVSVINTIRFSTEELFSVKYPSFLCWIWFC